MLVICLDELVLRVIEHQFRDHAVDAEGGKRGAKRFAKRMQVDAARDAEPPGGFDQRRRQFRPAGHLPPAAAGEDKRLVVAPLNMIDFAQQERRQIKRVGAPGFRRRRPQHKLSRQSIASRPESGDFGSGEFGPSRAGSDQDANVATEVGIDARIAGRKPKARR